MIDPKAVTTFAQYNEDLILAALLHDVKKGFYVDVGANYPTVDSVTKLFYDKGWSGINIEPIKKLHSSLKKERPRDINIQCGAGETNGTATLREYKDLSGHSTFDSSQKQRQDKRSRYEDYEVSIRKLEDILDEYGKKKIHFMKIDVEGFEYQVIKGNNWTKYRPEVICVEANHLSQDWRPLLQAAKYELFITDGLNEYYVAKESWQRTKNFAERIVEMDYHALKQHQSQSWSKDSEELERLHKIAAEQHSLITLLQKQTKELEAVKRLSLADRPYVDRLKRATYGLTVDWIKHRNKPSD